MNLRRVTIPLAFVVVGLGMLVALSPFYFRYDPHHSAFSSEPLARGEVLDFASLAPDEVIVLERIFLADAGESVGTRFVFSSQNGTMTKYDCTIEWHRFAEAKLSDDRLEGVFSLEEGDLEGLSAMLQLFRHRPQRFGTASVTYRIEHQRAGQWIGEERFLLPSDFRLHSRDLTPEGTRELAQRQQIPRGAFVGIITPDMIAERNGERTRSSDAGSR